MHVNIISKFIIQFINSSFKYIIHAYCYIANRFLDAYFYYIRRLMCYIFFYVFKRAFI